MSENPAAEALGVAVAARVLALRAPGAEPEPLDVRASPGDVPHWEI